MQYKKPKILIMNPPSFDGNQYIKEGRCESKRGGQLTPPISLAIISSLLSKKGYKNELYDFIVEPKKFKKIIKTKYDFIVINTSSTTINFDKKVVQIIKKNNKKTIVCAIGVIAKNLPNLLLKFGFDISVVSEPEETIVDIVKNLNKNLNKVKGIVFKNKSKVIKTSKREFIKNLDSLPFPDRSKLNNKKYLNPRTGKPFTVIKVQRGCPYNCNFCTARYYYGKKPRYRSVNNVLSEIIECINVYNIKDFLFLGDTFTINKKYVKNLCNEIIKQNLKISWSCNSRIDTFDYELGKIMKKAGCWIISFGVESGSKKILNENFKNINPKKAILVAEICQKLNIKSIMYYILGFPGETKEDMKKTVNLALEVKSDFARFFVASPLPGSRLYSKYGSKNLTALNLANVNNNLSRINDYELKKIIRNANLRFYLRPNQIIRTALSFDNIPNFINAIFNYAKSYIIH